MTWILYPKMKRFKCIVIILIMIFFLNFIDWFFDTQFKNDIFLQTLNTDDD